MRRIPSERDSAARLLREHRRKLRHIQRLVGEGKAAVIYDFARGMNKGGERCPAEPRSEADAAHAEFAKLLDGQSWRPLQAHQYIDRLLQRSADGSYVFRPGQARRVEHFSAGLLEGL